MSERSLITAYFIGGPRDLWKAKIEKPERYMWFFDTSPRSAMWLQEVPDMETLPPKHRYAMTRFHNPATGEDFAMYFYEGLEIPR